MSVKMFWTETSKHYGMSKFGFDYPWRISLHVLSTFQENCILFYTHATHVSRQTPNFLYTNVFFLSPFPSTNVHPKVP